MVKHLNPRDKGMHFYEDKIKVAQELGFDCVIDCVEHLYNSGVMISDIANTFDVTYQNISKMILRKICGKVKSHGGRRPRPNKRGVFKSLLLEEKGYITTNFVAARVYDYGMGFEDIYCIRCHKRLPEGVRYTRDMILKYGDSHKCGTRKFPTGRVYNNGRDCMVAGVVNLEEQYYKYIRCVKCNTIVSNDEIVPFYNVEHVTGSHFCKEYNRDTIFEKEIKDGR